MVIIMDLQGVIANNQTLSFDQLKADSDLVLEIQIKLFELGLYPGGRLLDGRYGDKSAKGIARLRRHYQINPVGEIDPATANRLLIAEPTNFRLETARNKEEVYQDFLGSEKTFIDSGISDSPFESSIVGYPDRLKENPDEIEVTSLGNSLKSSNGSIINLLPYPELGVFPTNFDDNGLDFMHSDIREACICIGSIVDGNIHTHWLGKNAKSNGQFWSATKMLAVLNVACEANRVNPLVDIDTCSIRDADTGKEFTFSELVIGIENYKGKPDSSNKLAATLRQFSTFEDLNEWVKKVTGNQDLQYLGRWGESPTCESPILFNKKLGTILSTAQGTKAKENSVSAYDLTRAISMLGWHHHLAQSARLPGGQWNSLECVVRGMGEDIGRYADAAIERLGLQRVIKSPVIISKSGWGRSGSRDRYEITYTALIQFIDNQPKENGQLAKLRTLAITLRAAKKSNNEEREVDARIASEITEILRRMVTDEW
jgi:hypothetical protein